MPMYSRRNFLRVLAGAAVGVVPLLSAVGRASGVKSDLSPTLVAPGSPLNLPAWKYGKDSFATDTVLMFRGSPSRSFYGTGPLSDNPGLKWVVDLSSYKTTLRGRPVTWSGTGWTGQASKLGDWVFVGSVDRHLYALNAHTGQLGWKMRAARMFKGSLCIYENRLYMGNCDNFLRCVDAATGKDVWKLDTSTDLDSSPCVVDGRLYVAGESGFVRCIDPRTGQVIWKQFVGGVGPGTLPGSNGSETSPAVFDGLLYTATYDGWLYCLDIQDGHIVWKARTFDDTDASPVVAGDFVYVASENVASFLYCFERKTGRLVWKYAGNPNGYWSTPAVSGGRIYIGGNDHGLHCVDALTGAPIWVTKVDQPIWSSPCVVDGRVVFGSYDNHLYMLDAVSGAVTWKYNLGGRCLSTPCIVGGDIFIGTASGRFFCFGG